MFDQWQSDLNTEKVIDYLLFWKSKGYSVIKGRPPIINGWTIVVDSTKWVGIRPSNITPGIWSVHVGNLGRSIGEVGTLNDLREYVEQGFKSQGVIIEVPPKQLNTLKDEPITNLTNLLTMTGGSKIIAISDDYFDNLALANLVDFHSLGGNLDSKIRISTGEQKYNQAKLTINFIQSFEKQIKSAIEIKINSNLIHERLIFLTDGRCLSPDFSLNDLRKSGKIVELTHPEEKIKVFEQQWQTGRNVR